MNNGKKIGERIRLARRAKEDGWSVRQLQKKVEELTLERGTSYGTIRAYDAGEVRHPRKEIISAIAQALGVSNAWLLTGVGPRDAAEASLPPRDQMAEPQGYGAEVFDRLYSMTQEVLEEYGPHSVPLEAARVILPLVARIYGERGPGAFWREDHFPAEWKGWETQREHFGSKPGVTKPDIKCLLEWHLGLAPVLDVNPRQSYGERVSGWLSALARVYIQEFGSGRKPDTAPRREPQPSSTEPKEDEDAQD